MVRTLWNLDYTENVSNNNMTLKLKGLPMLNQWSSNWYSLENEIATDLGKSCATVSSSALLVFFWADVWYSAIVVDCVTTWEKLCWNNSGMPPAIGNEWQISATCYVYHKTTLYPHEILLFLILFCPISQPIGGNGINLKTKCVYVSPEELFVSSLFPLFYCHCIGNKKRVWRLVCNGDQTSSTAHL